MFVSSYMCGVLSFDAMTITQKIMYNPRTGAIVGLAWERDQENLGVVRAEFIRAARRAAGDAPTEADGSSGELKLAKHYNVYYFNSLGKPNFAFPVARYCMGAITSASLLDQFDEVSMQLALRGKLDCACRRLHSRGHFLCRCVKVRLDPTV